MQLRPGLSCTAEIQTNMVKDVVAVPMQSVTIRTGDSNLSPEEIEKQKAETAAAKDRPTTPPKSQNERLEKQTEKEEREKLQKVVFLKNGEQGEDGQSHHRHRRRHLHGNQERRASRATK